jgi:excisionase family DNA binding protein
MTYLTTRELAALLRISSRTVQRRTRDKQLPHIRIGHVVRYPVEAIHQKLGEAADARR